MLSFVVQTIRALFFTLDKVIYGLIDDVYSLLLIITRTSIFDDFEIAQFAARVYALAGIFMLFKVSVSIIHYVINPDDFVDKEKGFATIWKRILMSLALLVLTPYIFQEAYNLQAYILEENTIFNLVFGSEAKNGVPNVDYVQNAGRQIQFVTMYSFMRPNFTEFYGDKEYDMAPCIETYNYDYSDGRRSSVKFRATDSGEPSAFIYDLVADCFGEYNAADDKYEPDNNTFGAAFKEAKADGLYQNYAQGVAQQNFGLMMRQDLILAKISRDGQDRYLIDYKLGVSTAVGVAIVYIFILFCIDIAVRSVKLGFLQMIAPIPILSYIDPKSGKDKGMFHQWYKMCISTYLSLFLRLFALYLGVYAITVIGGYYDFVTNEKITGNWLLNVFMIIGILMFAKQLPKIIEDIFGIKLDGSFHLNPLKKLEDEKTGMLGGKRLTGMAAGAAMGLTGRGPLGMVGGALGGFGAGKGWSDTKKAQIDKSNALRSARLDGSTWGGRMGARASNMLGTGGEMARVAAEKDRIAGDIKDFDDQIKSLKDQKERVQQRIAPQKQRIADYKKAGDSIKAMETRAKEEMQAGNTAAGKEFLRRKAEYERLKANPASTAAAIAHAEGEMSEWLNDKGMKKYMTDVIAGAESDATFSNMHASAKQVYEDVTGTALATDGEDIHKQFGGTKGEVGIVERAIYEHEQEIAGIDTRITRVTGEKALLGDEMRDIEDRERHAKANQSAVGGGGAGRK